jgi:hypothetical protein
MRKFLIVFLLLAVLSGFAMAQDLGLAVGAEVWYSPFEDANEDQPIGVGPLVEYENSFDALDVFVKAQYNILFDDDTQQAFYLEEEVAYNLPAGPGTLSIIVNNNNLFGTSIEVGAEFYGPDSEVSKDDKTNGTIEPAVKYALEADFGNIFGKISLPYAYMPSDYWTMDLQVAVGYEHSSGFGVEFEETIYLDSKVDPGKKDGLTEHDLIVYYQQKDYRVEVEFDFPKNGAGDTFKDYNITPRAEFYLDDLVGVPVDVWVGIPIWHFDAHGADSSTTPPTAGEKKTYVGFLLGGKYKL